MLKLEIEGIHVRLDWHLFWIWKFGYDYYYSLFLDALWLGLVSWDTLVRAGVVRTLVVSLHREIVTGFFCMMRSFADGNIRMDCNVCSEMSFGGSSCRVETSWLACVVNRLTGFCMIWVLTTSSFSKTLYLFILV